MPQTYCAVLPKGKRQGTIMQEDLIRLSRRYPQLQFPIRAGMRQTEAYKNAVLGGELPDAEPDFRCPAEIRCQTADTPAGRAEIVYLGDREDFLHAYQALAYRCEPTVIPDSSTGRRSARTRPNTARAAGRTGTRSLRASRRRKRTTATA